MLLAALAEFPSCLKGDDTLPGNLERRKGVAGTCTDVIEDVIENGSAAEIGGYVVFDLIHDGSDVFAVSAVDGVLPNSGAAGLTCPP